VRERDRKISGKGKFSIVKGLRLEIKKGKVEVELSFERKYEVQNFPSLEPAYDRFRDRIQTEELRRSVYDEKKALDFDFKGLSITLAVKNLKFLKYLASLQDETISEEIEFTVTRLFLNGDDDRLLLDSDSSKKKKINDDKEIEDK
jgi:hypothetical protein